MTTAFSEFMQVYHLTNERAARIFGVDRTTIVRWRNGSVAPPLAVEIVMEAVVDGLLNLLWVERVAYKMRP